MTKKLSKMLFVWFITLYPNKLPANQHQFYRCYKKFVTSIKLVLASWLLFCTNFCKNIWKKMCKMYKNCVKFFVPCVKFLQNFCTFQIYTAILDHVKRALVLELPPSPTIIIKKLKDRHCSFLTCFWRKHLTFSNEGFDCLS